VKFTPSGGQIRISAATPVEDDNLVEIRVVDTGIGIPADKLESIFEPFVQLDGGLTRSSQGTGLGLAISRDLAQAMHGDLVVRSEQGKGAEFVLTLPRGELPRGRGSSPQP
jgi:signal transduction histidine kinase